MNHDRRSFGVVCVGYLMFCKCCWIYVYVTLLKFGSKYLPLASDRVCEVLSVPRHGSGRCRARSRGQGPTNMANKALDVASMSLEVVKGSQKGGYK